MSMSDEYDLGYTPEQFEDLMTDADRFDFFCSVKGQTENALLVNDGDRDIWIPKSLMTMDQRAEIEYMNAGDSFKLSIPEWFADQKELT